MLGESRVLSMAKSVKINKMDMTNIFRYIKYIQLTYIRICIYSLYKIYMILYVYIYIFHVMLGTSRDTINNRAMS